MKLIKQSYTIPIAMLLLVAAYFPIFLHLDSIPIQLWDEARLATNALEMSQDANIITTHFNHQPDMWNTKPPLMIWLQALSIKAFGVNELSVRLPSAIAAALTVILLFVFSLKFTKRPYMGLVAGLTLITTNEYICIHATRTGDYDSLLTFFTTFYLLAYFAWTETGKVKYLVLFFTVLILSAFTKGIAGLLMLPAIFIYTLISRKLLPVIKQPATWLGILSFVVMIGGYYLLREQNNPGFLQTMFKNEIGGRYLNQLEGHSGGVFYYVEQLYRLDNKFFWFPLFIVALVLAPMGLNTSSSRISLYLTICIISFTIILSSAGTKLIWYLVPVYPLIALLIGIFISGFIDWLVENGKVFSPKNKVTFFLACLALFAYPYSTIVAKCYYDQFDLMYEDDYRTASFMSKLIKSNTDLSDFYYVANTYDPQNRFYLHVHNSKGQYIKNRDSKDIHAGEKTIVFGKETQDYIKDRFIVNVKLENGNLAFYEILGQKKPISIKI